MKITKVISLTILVFFISSFTVSAKMLLFVGESCPFCQKLEKYLEENSLYEKHDIQKYEIYSSENNRNLYMAKAIELNYRNGGIPWLVDGEKQVEGTDSIINYLKNLDNNIETLPQSTKQTVLDRRQSEILNNIIRQELKNKGSSKKDETSGQTKRSLLVYILIISIPVAAIYFSIFRPSAKK